MPITAIVPVAAIFCSTVVLVTIMQLIARFIDRPRTSQALPNDELTRRLERIEQIVESTAVEVERIGESNRFVVKLLGEKTDAAQ
jgi:hypothetical protein